MNELTDTDLALIRAARAGLEPTPEDFQRIAKNLHALGAPLVKGEGELASPGSTSSGLTDAGRSVGVPRAWSAKGMFGAGAGVGVLSGLALGYLTFASAPNRVQHPKDAAGAVVAVPVEDQDPVGNEPAPASESEPTEAGIDPSARAREVRGTEFRAQVGSPHPLTGSVATKTGAPEDLSEELFLLTRARRALSNGQPALALGLLVELAEKHPRGQLHEERKATRILALCAMGQTATARKELDPFREQHPSSIYLERLASACANDGPASAPPPETEAR